MELVKLINSNLFELWVGCQFIHSVKVFVAADSFVRDKNKNEISFFFSLCFLFKKIFFNHFLLINIWIESNAILIFSF